MQSPKNVVWSDPVSGHTIEIPGPDSEIVKNFTIKEALRLTGMSPEQVEAEEKAFNFEIACLKQSREVLNTALNNPKFTRHWSRAPGQFVDPETGKELVGSHLRFEGTVRDWYGTLIEAAFGMYADHTEEEKFRAGEMFFICSPEIATILEWTMAFETLPGTAPSPSPEVVGRLFHINVYKDPYFPTNKLMVGYGDLSTPGSISVRSSSNLEIQQMNPI